MSEVSRLQSQRRTLIKRLNDRLYLHERWPKPEDYQTIAWLRCHIERTEILIAQAKNREPA